MTADDATAAATVQLGFVLPPDHRPPGSRDEDSTDGGDDAPRLGHGSPRWSAWDGGKVGGRPSWLNPRDLPARPLRCRGPCGDGDRAPGGGDAGTALRFVAQLYCPADDATGNAAAFHRSLYVFACPTCCSAPPAAGAAVAADDGGEGGDDDGASSATTSSQRRRLSGCVRVLRCQLPKRNDFYPLAGADDDEEEEEEEWTRHTSEYWSRVADDDTLNLCAVCGQRGRGRCPKQGLWFCGADHQRERLRASKQRRLEEEKKEEEDEPSRAREEDLPLRYLPSVCYESELVVEEEPAAAAGDLADTTSPGSNSNANAALFSSGNVLTDADVGLEQADLNSLVHGDGGASSLARAATGLTDPTTLAFFARMAVGGQENDVRDQCLRYCRWPAAGTPGSDDDGDEEGGGGPLWISSRQRPAPPAAADATADEAAPAFPPPCQYCGAPRAFEFQLLPQMLQHLLHAPDRGATPAAVAPVLPDADRAVLLEAQARIEGGAALPAGFAERHAQAVGRAREALLGAEGGEGGAKEGLDWGAVAVYTCTASCGDGAAAAGGVAGAYREEAAWAQPPLD